MTSECYLSALRRYRKAPNVINRLRHIQTNCVLARHSLCLNYDTFQSQRYLAYESWVLLCSSRKFTPPRRSRLPISVDRILAKMSAWQCLVAIEWIEYATPHSRLNQSTQTQSAGCRTRCGGLKRYRVLLFPTSAWPLISHFRGIVISDPSHRYPERPWPSHVAYISKK